MINPIPAIKIKQFSMNLYLSRITAEDLAFLLGQKYLKVEKYQSEEEETYQRREDKSRIKELSDFLTNYQNDDLVKPILPASVILNAPDPRDLVFDEERNLLTIKKGAKLNIVDGQHRVRGVVEAFSKFGNSDFELPVTFITDLERFQEAAQFLIINVKQKQVRTDLTLTVLHDLQKNRAADFVERLKKALDIDAWQLEATQLTIALNEERRSPWHNLIRRPNDDRRSLRDRGIYWTPIRQASFVDSLRDYCSPAAGKFIDLNSKVDFLIKYWNIIKNNYPHVFDNDTGKNYLFLKGICIGPIHVIASLLYILDKTGYMAIEDSLEILKNKYPLQFWSSDNHNGARKWGSSQKEFKGNARDIVNKLFPDLYEYWDEDKLDRWLAKDVIEEDVGASIRKLFDPLNLKPATLVDAKINEDSKGCYILIDKSRGRLKVYCGQSETIQKRLAGHENSFKLYNSLGNLEKDELDDIEALIYHLIKIEYRINDNHPPRCRYCKLKE
jgi:DGQHR domain-containing protein